MSEEMIKTLSENLLPKLQAWKHAKYEGTRTFWRNYFCHVFKDFSDRGIEAALHYDELCRPVSFELEDQTFEVL